MVSTEPTTERGISIRRRTIRGHLEVIIDPGNLRARVTVDGEQPVELRLPGDALERALLFDGQDASVSYRETSFRDEIIDCTVGIVNRGEPMTGAEFVARLDEITEGMTQAEREAWADSLDPKWRDR